MGFDYSDGRRVEEFIAGLLDGAPDLSSGARIAWQEQDRQWPVRYHLAPERANLLRHLEFSGLDVLELGAGMGGVSRFLAESCRHLTVVEGGSRRFQALARRLSDLSNWRGWFGRLEHFASSQRYDVICLVGVLEYAERFIVPPEDFEGDAFDYLLVRVRQLLKPDGVLLLAIENRLGLKYWSGVAEDHSGMLFDGIVGYPDHPVARTFSRQELLGRLEGLGWSCQREYFPFPDYKLPSTVIDGALANADPELTADLACFHVFGDPLQPRSTLFSDYLAMQQLTRAGLFSEMANSFLWAISPDSDSKVFAQLTQSHHSGPREAREVAWHASASRQRPVLTRFFMTPDEQVEVEKISLSSPPIVEDSRSVDLGPLFGEATLRWRAGGRQAVQKGERLRHRLLRALYFRQGRQIVTILTDYLRWALRQFADPSPESDGQWLGGEALDALVSNVTVVPSARGGDRGGTHYLLYDQEWSLDAKIPLSWFVLRNVACLLSDAILAHPDLGFSDLASLYLGLCNTLGVEADLERDVRFEACLLGAVSTRPAGPIESAIRGALEEPFSRVQPPRTPDFAVAWDNHLQHLVKVRRELEAGSDSLQEAVDWQQVCLRQERNLAQEHSEKAEWLFSRVQQSELEIQSKSEAMHWLDSQLEETRQSRQLALDAYSGLETEYGKLVADRGKLVADRDKLADYARQLEAMAQQQQEQQLELQAAHHATQQELVFASRRVEELYVCLHELTTLLNGRAHRWLEMVRRVFVKVVGRRS